MTYKEFCAWCNDRAADGYWGMITAMACIDIMKKVRKKPFWKREKIWKTEWEQRVLDEIVNPINEKIEAMKEEERAFNQAARKIIREMPTLTPPNEWVSVEDRLPEKRKDVLVHYGNGRIGMDWIDSTQCFVFDELYGRVTHWLPIPELPDRCSPEGEEET